MDLHPVLCEILGLVKGDVGPLERGDRIAAVVVQRDQPDAGADRYGTFSPLEIEAGNHAANRLDELDRGVE